ncbi:hypothetical protein [Clostridium botulinum]|uniref:hypothetical protein n=1 Tax=Clostridium botulinum TaxID=1491 RepID=UPI0021C1020F|nr:hypothetical protein [Clostridium botulinum]
MKFNKKGKAIAAIILVIAVVIGIFAFKIFHRVTNSPMIKSEDRNDKFIADIEFLKKELPKKHKNLSNINIDVNYSSNYFKTSDEDTDSIYPNVEINLNAESFFNGQDDFLEYVIRQ